VQATVVRAVRPTSAKPGDRALILADGTIEGFVGGSCAESSVRLQGLRVLASGEPVMLRISPELGQPEGDIAPGLVTVTNPCLSGGMLEIFLEGVFPPPLVEVLGDGPVAAALRAVGQALGYDLRRVRPGGRLAAGAEAVIVASHGPGEEHALRAALDAGVPYIALVASRRRGAAVLARLEVPEKATRPVHTPAGLDIGARTAEEIALSIFAEFVAERRGVPRSGATTAGAAMGDAVARPAHLPAPAAATTAPAGPATAVDPVCGMTVAQAGAITSVTPDGTVHYFCGPGCRDAFAEDPGR
jgi:xanthine dehydrogenase accessory factor